VRNFKTVNPQEKYMSDVKVISLGGSIIVPEQVDTAFLAGFFDLINNYLNEDDSRKIILVCGGGGLARSYQKAYRNIKEEKIIMESQDWIGIKATHLNAELLRHIFSEYCPSEVITDPTASFVFPGRVLVAAGWKPGFSTDYDAVLLAEKFSGNTVINLSNIEKVYTDDPDINPDAIPLEKVSWTDFREIVGDEWIPGKNAPFDPIASRYASKINLKVIVASGKNLENLDNILRDRPFTGTTIGPE
jgi:uridylate kinase